MKFEPCASQQDPMSQWSANARSPCPLTPTMRRRTTSRPIDAGPGTRDSFTRQPARQGLRNPSPSAAGVLPANLVAASSSSPKWMRLSHFAPPCCLPYLRRYSTGSVPAPHGYRLRHLPRSSSDSKSPSFSVRKFMIRHSPSWIPGLGRPSARPLIVVGWFTTLSSRGPF